MSRATSTHGGRRGDSRADPLVARLSRVARRNVAATGRLSETLTRQGLPMLSTRQLQAFLGHELRAPLSAAILHVGLARRQLATGQAAAPMAALEAAESELRRLDSLISRVTELAREGRVLVHPSRCDLSQAVHAAARRALVVLPRVSSMLTVRTDGPLLGSWDAVAAEQIVQNLIFNAEKFSGGRSIDVVLEPITGGARIRVCDDGCGLVPVGSARIFRARYRSVLPRREGDGLGLWLVQRLAEAHGGQVAVDSRPGQGAAFTVTLREMEQDLPRKGRRARRDARGGASPPGRAARPTSRAKRSARRIEKPHEDTPRRHFR